jgi:hypothetical protein
MPTHARQAAGTVGGGAWEEDDEVRASPATEPAVEAGMGGGKLGAPVARPSP